MSDGKTLTATTQNPEQSKAQNAAQPDQAKKGNPDEKTKKAKQPAGFPIIPNHETQPNHPEKAEQPPPKNLKPKKQIPDQKIKKK